MLGLGNAVSTHLTPVIFDNQYALSFDGTNDFIEVDDAAGEIDTDKGTIAMWVKLDAMSSSGHIIKATSGNDNNYINIFWHNGNAEIRFVYRADSTTKRVDSDQASLENDGNWHHIAMTWVKTGATAGTLIGYVDGSAVSEEATTGLTAFDAATSVMDIGRNAHSGAAYFAGDIDEVAIFNATLSASNVSELYNSGVVKDPRGTASASKLIAYWRFEEGSGNDALELVAGNTGTISGATYITTVKTDD